MLATPKLGSRSMALTVAEVAELLAVSPRTVRFWSDTGYLPSFRTPGGQRRFSPLAVAHFHARRSD